MLEDTDQLDQETEHLIALLLAVPRPSAVAPRAVAASGTVDDEPYDAVDVDGAATLDGEAAAGDDEAVLTSAVRA